MGRLSRLPSRMVLTHHLIADQVVPADVATELARVHVQRAALDTEDDVPCQDPCRARLGGDRGFLPESELLRR
jgi:hypothetical protein